MSPAVGRAIMPATAFQAVQSRLKVGCSQDWLPHGGV
jgi:hypothetical protein